MLPTVLFLALTLLTTAILLLFLWRAGNARALTVWLLAALLPLLAALTASLWGQARAQRALQGYAPAPVVVDIITGKRRYRASLTALDAACLERNLRLEWEGRLSTPPWFIPIDRHSSVIGTLPPSDVVQALSVTGQLRCAAFVSHAKDE
ncbi:hypothetical protein [Deinococcus cavernae]|uniref:hypothetical protein n=1 Tax=Deinococcus cavernae TaxID=2320857 RepID=UPI001F41F41B|nr:hypothetical protein [Deinococcus cavernae]